MSICARVAFCAVLVAYTTAFADDANQELVGTTLGRANVIEEFEVAQNGDFLVVPLEIDGRSYNFFLSTYHDVHEVDSILDARRAFETGIRQRDKDGFPIDRYQLRAHLGKSRIRVEGLAQCKDMSNIRDNSGHDVYGVLGMSFLKSKVIQIDFENGKLYLLNAVPANPGAELRLSFDGNGAPLLAIDLPSDERVSFHVALGHARFVSGSFEKHVFRRLVDAGKIAVGNEPPHLSHDGYLDALRVADLEERHLPFAEGNRNRLGQGFLARFDVIFDFPNGRMYLKRRTRIPTPINPGECGFEISRTARVTYIDSVDETGSARSAGLCKGDRILKVNGTDARARSLFELRRVLFERGSHVQLVVYRDGKILECEIIAE